MSGGQCQHRDVRKFDGLRCCLACGEVVFETLTSNPPFEPDSPAPSPYEYTDLNYKLGQEVRLCVVLPGEPADQIQCEIIHVNLEDDPEYEAVSYTWASGDGDTTLSKSINCGGGRYISVTANCEAALRQLRKRGLKRRLWIDAISINQGNINERNHQVGLMDRIYSRARSVRICIQNGTGSSGYRRLFDWLQGASTTDIADVESWLPPMMISLLSMRYFKRVWVVQEVAFATTAYLLVNNDELLITSSVMDRFSLLAMHSRYQLPGVLLRWNAGQMPLADIVTCLRAGIDCNCTDPRDRIFAVLSFMDPQARSLILVDYSLGIAPVYTSAVVAVIASHRNLDVLSYAGSEGPLSDWHTGSTLTMDQFKNFLIDKDAQKRTDSSTACLPSEHLRKPRLAQFEGNRIGPWRADIEVYVVDEMDIVPDLVVNEVRMQVVLCRRPRNPASMNILPRFQARAHFIDNIHQFPSSSLRSMNAIYIARSMSVETKTPAHLWLANYAWILPLFRTHQTNCLPDTLPSIGRPLRSLGPDDLPGINLEDLTRFLRIVIDQGSFKQMFITTHSVGFAPRGFESGDEIWAIDGARAPFVLRKTGPRTYRIVTDCYLWAALELDYWNPGTKKGRWSEDRPAHSEEQTHIIELY